MKTKKSPILQMLMGEKGNFDTISVSDDYKDAQTIAVKKIEDFKKQLEDFPKLLKQFDDLLDAYDNENAIYASDVYKEAFAFGLAMGQEIFDDQTA